MVVTKKSMWIIVISLIVVVSGCVPQIRYINYGVTQEQMLKDRYECYQETQQTSSNVYIGSPSASVDQWAEVYGGTASRQVIPSCGAFNACMAARGYIRDDRNGNLIVPDSTVMRCEP